MSSPATTPTNEANPAKLVAVALAVTVVALMLIRYLLVPKIWAQQPSDFASITVGLIDSLIAAALATISLVVVTAVLRPRTPSRPEFSVLRPNAIKPALSLATQTTTSWRFAGTTGHWCCTEALPAIARHTLNLNRDATATLILLDPANQSAVDAYIHYRRSLFSGREDTSWTTERVTREILATIVRQYSLQTDYPHLAITVFLKPMSSILRYDESDDRIFITREDLRESAVLGERGTFFYEAVRRDLGHLKAQSRQIPPFREAPHLRDITVESTRLALKHASLLDLAPDDRALELIATRAGQPQ